MYELAGNHLLKIREAAAILRVSPGSLYRLAKRRAVVSFKIPGVGLRFRPADLEKFIASGRRSKRDAAICSPKN